jgi:hypothetical protein
MLSITAGSSIHATLVASVSAGNKRLYLAEFGRSESGWLGPFLLHTGRSLGANCRDQWVDLRRLHRTIPASAFSETTFRVRDGYRWTRPVDCRSPSTR